MKTFREIPTTYNELYQIIEDYDLNDIYEEATSDDDYLSQEDLCEIMKLIILTNCKTYVQKIVK